jgi:hypothetical protein
MGRRENNSQIKTNPFLSQIQKRLKFYGPKKFGGPVLSPTLPLLENGPAMMNNASQNT